MALLGDLFVNLWDFFELALQRARWHFQLL
jgi:hypothetical protein